MLLNLEIWETRDNLPKNSMRLSEKNMPQRYALTIMEEKKEFLKLNSTSTLILKEWQQEF